MTPYREFDELDDSEKWEAFQTAEETVESLRKKNAKLRAALETELTDLVRRTEHITHYEGCAKDHPMCAAIVRISEALKK